MEYRTLSTTDLKVSRLCFGTMTFGSQTDEAAASRIVDRCIDAGINFFDTANVYNKGAAETILAKALAGKRQKVILATKVCGKMGDGPDESGLSRALVEDVCGVEEVYSRIDAPVDDPRCRGLVSLGAEGHGAEAEPRDL